MLVPNNNSQGTGYRLHFTLTPQAQRGLRVWSDIAIALDGRVPSSSHNFSKDDNLNADRGTLKPMFNLSHAEAL